MEPDRVDVEVQSTVMQPTDPMIRLLVQTAATSHVDMATLRLCRHLGGHHGEGRILLGRAVGRCARCGVGLLIDGS